MRAEPEHGEKLWRRELFAPDALAGSKALPQTQHSGGLSVGGAHVAPQGNKLAGWAVWPFRDCARRVERSSSRWFLPARITS